MDPRPLRPARRRALLRAAASPCLVVLTVALGIAGCDSATPSVSPSPSAVPSAAVPRPAIQLDREWTALNGDWTFTGQVDPQDDPTNVILEIGPGPATARVFDTQVPVEASVTSPTPLSVTTRAIPDIKEICVRFSATNGGGTATTSPLCFPHDLPSIAPPGTPTVEIDPHWATADGKWSFTGRIDPKGAPTDVVLELGRGPSAAPKYSTRIPVQTDLAEQATVTFATDQVPDAAEVCVRFSATNAVGTVSSEPLCFDPHAPPS